MNIGCKRGDQHFHSLGPWLGLVSFFFVVLLNALVLVVVVIDSVLVVVVIDSVLVVVVAVIVLVLVSTLYNYNNI